MHTPDHIRNRIEWCARKHGLPKSQTGFWHEVPTALRAASSSHIHDPIVYSMTPSGHATVIGTDGVFVIGPAGHHFIPMGTLAEITSEELSKAKQKMEFSELMITDLEGHKHPAYTEQGPPCFAVWNIILMLTRMNERANQTIQSPPLRGVTDG